MKLTVNGKPANFEGDPDTPILWVLRDHLDVTSPKFGCGMALCGACTVHLDGAPIRSCSTPVSAAVGKKSPPLKVCRRRLARLCRMPGWPRKYRSVVTARPDR